MATRKDEGDGETANKKDKDFSVKVICLGDSAVGKSKLVERFLMDGYKPQQLSTYALTLFQYKTKVDDKEVNVDFWDTAGQERFSSMHPSYYHQAHACILVFDITRKITYKNLPNWYKELRQYRDSIPCIVVANKIDVDYKVTQKSFNFPKKYNLPFYFVSASDGSNVVKVFREAIRLGVQYKENSTDFMDMVMQELENFDDLNITENEFDQKSDEENT
ncbi:rab-like protein 2A [Exaiptasia diaphana]|uniref:Rab-like protein 2A n=1 Tax=Exaiptasia diaphana TaxID=2652724 RepID=A0A913Y8T7_EXADI|nr:rab-like protein 2A [Exaiptasia diaphana]XP_020916595.1 rab-like protein 2A [Exaiptasia diaphana]KXJ21587.1 Rab-like protein 2A [Exaiptasia diaphana]KXJ21640.1 Rab-like protein 2A [Exaiptasia diaphana]